MRLKKLTMQAFGPFKDKVVIDFENNCIDKGLLLITGDTGAGKTTIFDAICFALYGQSSGEVRTINSLRSDWASPDVETYVELEFYYKNKKYEIRRCPEYVRRKKNGSGETKQPATAEFDIDGRIVTKVTDVTKEVERLIGIDYKQFRQIAMLSQGEFTKFLLATSEEKTTIFRKIFGTEFYDVLQNKLKFEKNVKAEEMEKFKDKIDTERKNLESIVDIYGLNSVETINVLEERIKEDSAKIKDVKVSRDEKNEERTKLINEINNYKELNRKINVYNDSKERLFVLNSSNKNIDIEKKQYDYNISVAFSITSLLNNLERDQKLFIEKEKKLELAKKDLELKQKQFKDKEVVYSSLDDYSKNIEKITDEIAMLMSQIDCYEKYLNKKNELNLVLDEYKVNTEKYEIQNEKYEDMRRKFYLNISVEIADSLKDGDECPVCGSRVHPKKALPSGFNYTKEDIENEERLLKKIDSQRKKNEASIDEIKKVINEFNIDDDIDVLEEINVYKQNLLDKKQEKEFEERRFMELSKEKQKLTSEIVSLSKNKEIFEDDLSVLEKNIDDIKSKLDDIYKENNTDYDDYKNKKLDKVELNILKNKIDDYNKTKQELESVIKTLEEDVLGKENIDLTDKEIKLNILNDEYKELDKLYTDMNAVILKLTDSTKNIKEYIGFSKKIENEFFIVKMLSDTANGVLSGKKKITFENYVQAYFMNSVLVEANKRLVKMTDGRFELKKKEIESRLNAKTGLEFSIFDAYTGKERDVSSMSGGEKFKASLALALGLSDTISNNIGGIKIDSLFIDEGFGSLDSESLNQALNILSDLSGNDKLVGVISHVSELLSRIDNKIFVNKTNTGSVLSIES